MYALILATGFIGVLINVLVRRVERSVLAWHTSVRGEAVL
jgi:ABC-type nitrate/sulfonate/bicarbonate transport system permease component